MADKSVGELIAAQSVTPTDLFVLEQNGTAKKLTGQILENWLVSFADGHGGIQSIAKLGTSGLADTYRITLADTTVYDFVVTNGRGISSLQKTGTSGLVDTYRFTYNDGTKGTFTVTNGQKGDKGDNAYIWVKYASQEPTTSSNSFGDLPDDWMGVYFGTASTAPTNWQSYKWYRIKGKKGDTGEPATIVRAEITYQASDSGTIIPSGSWETSVPPVTPGRYLWTRQVLQFNTGNPVTSYIVSRFGMDGTGAVSAVAGVAPDSSGNVPLTADSVKALALVGGTMQGSINMNGQRLTGLNAPKASNEAATKGFVESAVKNVDVSGKVDKEDVVNNFTTTGAGFVADARALKTLNDSKLSMDMVYENANLSSDFVAHEGDNAIVINDNDYQFIDAFFATSSSSSSIQYCFRIKVDTSTTADIPLHQFLKDYTHKFASRNVSVTRKSNGTLSISIGKCTTKDGKTLSDSNSRCIPARFYGIKGGIG